jgi:IS4 transposase
MQHNALDLSESKLKTKGCNSDAFIGRKSEQAAVKLATQGITKATTSRAV